MSAPYAAMTVALQDNTLAPEGFGHLQHLGVAHHLLKTCDFLDALVIYSKGIQNLAARAGVSDKFNLTVTLAFLSIMAERINAAPDQAFEPFLEDNPDLMSRDLLEKFYTQDRSGTALARKVFLMP
ncbi:MAG: hypothetical protein COA52_13890 [Hyphomicrobiales bacterium]|nr:hypothetical protein [Hyphomicrobiales bacterium]PCJ87585.1 MAG: hypothetical protein COA52_13890 [Hyphomicrobiales bacterium]